MFCWYLEELDAGAVIFVSEDAGCCECSAGTLRSWMQVLRCLLVKMLSIANVVQGLCGVGLGVVMFVSEDAGCCRC